MELTEKDLELIERSAPGNAAIYRLRGGVFETLYLSEGMYGLNGMTRDEYEARTRGDAGAIVLDADRPGLMDAVRKSLRDGGPVDHWYRVEHKALGFDWAHVCARQCGTLGGDPVFLAEYTNASVETDVYQRILDRSQNMAYVCDRATYEVLYANRAAREKSAGGQYGVRTCYDYIFGRKTVCDDCLMDRCGAEPLRLKRYNEARGAYELVTGELLSWCGRDAFVQYITDISVDVRREKELRDLAEAHEAQLIAVRALSGPEPLDERLERALRNALTYYGAERAYIFAFDDESGATLSNTFEVCREGVEPEKDKLQHMDAHIAPRWLAAFRRREVLVEHVDEALRASDPAEYEALVMQGIRSCIEAPIYAGGRLCGFFGVDDPAPERILHSGDLLLAFSYAIGDAMARDESEKATAARTAELETVLRCIPVGLAVVRVRDGRAVSRSVNPLLQALYGLPGEPDEGTDAFVNMRVHPADRAVLADVAARLAAPDAGVSLEFRYDAAGDGVYRWYRLRARVLDFSGERMFISVVEDITAEREAGAAERRARRVYEAAADLAGLSVWVYDPAKRTITLTDSAVHSRDLRLYNIPRVIENVPDAIAAWVEPEDMPRLRAVYEAVRGGAPRASCEYRYRVQPGRPRRTERVVYTTEFGEDGRPVSAIGIGMDISPEVEEREKFTRALAALGSVTPDTLGIWRFDLTNNTCLGAQDARGARTADRTADGFFARVGRYIPAGPARETYFARYSRAALLDAFARGEIPAPVEYAAERGGGGRRFISANCTLLRNPDSGSVECVVYAKDVTDERRRDAIFRLVTDQECDYVALLHLQDNTLEFTSLNARLPRLYRERLGPVGRLHDFDELRAFTADSWVDAADREAYLAHSSAAQVRAALERDGRCEMSLRGHTQAAPDETMCRRLCHYWLGADRDTVLLIQTDVTATYLQEKAEGERARAEARFATDILDSVASGICVLRMPDPDHLVGEFVNLTMFRILGYETPSGGGARAALLREPTVASYVADAFTTVHPDDRARIQALYRDHYGDEHFAGGVYRILRRDGTPVWVDQEMTLHEARADGRVFYATYRVVDREVELQSALERRLEAEKGLRAAADAANAAKSEFLSRMSHDIRTPINAITGMTAFAREDLGDDAKVRAELDKIDGASRHLLSLVNDVLDISGAESGRIELHPEPYPYDEYLASLRAMFEPLCAERGLRFEVVTQPGRAGCALVDRVRFDQIAINLLSNAVKYTPRGGTVKYISASRLTDDGRVDVRYRVCDTGIGMSAAFQKKMFEPFSQENDNPERTRLEAGTGLGLSIVKRLVDRMGGDITVCSEVGKGTEIEVHFVLPAATPQELAAEAAGRRAAEEGEAPLHGRVLLAEDNRLNTEIAVRLLESFGLTVDTAANGAEAVECFSQSAPDTYGAVLLDIQMPLLDGYGAARRIRALGRADGRTVPIAAMTADAFADDVRRAAEAGMDAHIAKPIDPAELRRVLGAMLGEQGPRPEGPQGIQAAHSAEAGVGGDRNDK